MTVAHIPEHVAAFITELAALQPTPNAVWLIGSRANGRANDKSDTDLLVFGSEALIDAARSHLERPESTDCLIVYDDDEYRDPWQQKSGSLCKLKWQQVDDGNAKYVGTRWIPDEESSLEFGADMGDLVERQERAVRLWP